MAKVGNMLKLTTNGAIVKFEDKFTNVILNHDMVHVHNPNIITFVVGADRQYSIKHKSINGNISEPTPFGLYGITSIMIHRQLNGKTKITTINALGNAEIVCEELNVCECHVISIDNSFI